MINGDGIGRKYNEMVAKRRAELVRGLPKEHYETIHEPLWEFMCMLRNSTIVEFEQWHQLYGDEKR